MLAESASHAGVPDAGAVAFELFSRITGPSVMGRSPKQRSRSAGCRSTRSITSDTTSGHLGSTGAARSEERRVGKECRCRRWPERWKTPVEEHARGARAAVLAEQLIKVSWC